MDKRELRNNLEEIALAASLFPYGNEPIGDEPFRHSDESTLLDIGFTYLDTFNVKSVRDGITYYVSFTGNYPHWEYMVHGKHHTPRPLGRVKYRHICDKLEKLSAHLIAKENGYSGGLEK